METNFEHVGYFKDYYVNRKFVGSILVNEKDREVYGYTGRKEEVLTEDMVINKKKLKKGTTVITELGVLCGRVK
jgi:hypothetical protein